MRYFMIVWDGNDPSIRTHDLHMNRYEQASTKHLTVQDIEWYEGAFSYDESHPCVCVCMLPPDPSGS